MSEPRNDGRRRDTRDRLIEAAIDAFRHDGPGGTGLSTVCVNAGTTKGVLSHHFPDGKRELLLAAVDRNASDVDAVLERLIARTHTIGAAITAFFDMYADLLRDDPDFGCPLAAAVVDASRAETVVRESLGTAFHGWIAKLRDALVERGWSRSEAKQFATTTVAAMEGAILLSRASRNPAALRDTGRWLGAAADQHEAVIAS